MYGRKVKLRFFFIFLAIVTLALSIFLILKSLEENVVYFKSPSEIKIDAEMVNVVYSGAVPNLFQEGKGVVAEGYLKDRNFFLATKILAKHDENYMPPEVKEALEGK